FERLAGHYLPLSIGVTIGYAENINTIPDDLQEIRPTVITSVPHLFEKVFTQIMDQINKGSPVKKRIFEWAVEVGKEKYNYIYNLMWTIIYRKVIYLKIYIING